MALPTPTLEALDLASLRACFDNLFDCFGIYAPVRDDHGRITDFQVEYVNSAGCDNNLLTSTEQVGRLVTEILPGHRGSALLQHYARVIETGEKWEAEAQPHRDVYAGEHETRWFDVRAWRVSDRLAIIWRDVTARESARQELQTSREPRSSVCSTFVEGQELLDALIDHTPVLLCIWDPRLQRFRFNRQFTDLLGWTEDDAADGDFMTKVAPDPAYRQQVVDHMQALDRGFRDIKTTAKDGSVIDIAWANIGLSNDVRIGIGVDIRERLRDQQALRQSEATLAAVFESLPVGVGIADATGTVRSLNPAGLAIHGFGSLADMLASLEDYRKRFELLSIAGERLPHDQWPVARAMRGDYVRDLELRLRRPDGAERRVTYTAVPVPGEHPGETFTVFLIQDVTDARKAMDTLDQQQRHLALVIDTAPAFIAQCDRELHYRFANQAYATSLGIRPEQIIGKHVSVVLGDAFASSEPHMRKALAGQEVHYELELRVGDMVRHLDVRYAPDRTADGQIDGFVVVGIDITARRAAEKALRESEQRFRSLFSNMTEAFALGEPIFDEAGRPVSFRFLEVNQAFHRQSGLGKEVVGRPITEVVPNLEPEWIETYARIATTRQPTEFVNYNRATDRHYQVVAYSPEPGRFAILFHDISQERQLQESLRQSNDLLGFTLDATRVGQWELDLVTDETHRSLRHDQIFGYQRIQPTWGYDIFLNQHVHPDDREYVDQSFKEALATCGDWEFECRINRVDGVERWIWAKGSVSSTDHGKPRRLAGLVMDITERKQAEQQLHDLNAVLEARVHEGTQAVREQSEQVRNLAMDVIEAEERERKRIAVLLHDGLQQLLTAMAMRIELLRPKLGDEHEEDWTTLRQLVDESVAAARTLSVELSPSVLRDAGLMPALNWLTARFHEQHALKVELRVDEAAEPTDASVRNFLFRAARELLFNVVKHADCDVAELTVERRDGMIRLEVADQGKGCTTLQSNGTGLGLFSIVQRARHLGGWSSITTAGGQGCRVELVVPMQVTTDDAAATEPA